MTQWHAPVLISTDHDIQDFDCGESSLNEWLKKRAFKNQQTDSQRI